MSKYFSSYNNSIKNIKVELDLSNYATKDDVKNIRHVDVSSYASKTNLAALKTEADKIDTDKLMLERLNMKLMEKLFMTKLMRSKKRFLF